MAAPHPVLGASSGRQPSFHSHTSLCSITVMYLLVIRANTEHFVPARGNPIPQKEGFWRGPLDGPSGLQCHPITWCALR